MDINRAGPVGSVPPVVSPPHADPGDGSLPSDSVSMVDASRMAGLARAAQGKVDTLRTVRLARIEKAIRTGDYRPSASQIATRLLEAAEVDEHLRRVVLARGAGP